MKYIPVSDEEKNQKIKEAGGADIDDLFRSVPESVRMETSARLTPPMSEIEIRRYFRVDFDQVQHSFLGGNGHHHYIPSIINPLTSRGEFLTAYTPYQPEISQGTLQAMYEFQSMMADLMGVEVSNASVYDGSTSMLEAAFMAIRITGRSGLFVSDLIHPEYLHTLHTYSVSEVFSYETIRSGENGRMDAAYLRQMLAKSKPAAVIVQSPNYYGIIEDIKSIRSMPEMADVLIVAVITEAMSMGLIKSPGSLGADIVCGEAQSFGIPLSYGGPWLGFLGSSMKNVRNMPGRLVGEAKDTSGRRSFVVTLATREQHIRREKATSNICTNQGLMALRCTIYLSVMGKQGIRRAAERSARFAAYAKKLLVQSPAVKIPFKDEPMFNEFVIETPVPAKNVFDYCVKHARIAPGNIIGERRLLAAFDETRSPSLIEKWAVSIIEACKKAGDEK